MRKIKNYNRSTMTEHSLAYRLSCIALLSIESELTSSIDVDQLVDIRKIAISEKHNRSLPQQMYTDLHCKTIRVKFA